MPCRSPWLASRASYPLSRRIVMMAGAAAVAVPAAALAEPRPASPVVVELFTSQGCSSCPPADALLGDLARQPQVVALAWHVDYWNHLGWRDRYASMEWTSRQRHYASLLDDEVYTPALVVNGRRMVVGSDRRAVAAAMAAADPLPISTLLKRSPNGLIARVGPRPPQAVVSLIVYDGEHATAVQAGENAGRSLRESRIARSMQMIDTSNDEMILPGGALAPDQGAVLLVQDHDWHVLGSAQVRPANEGPL